MNSWASRIIFSCLLGLTLSVLPAAAVDHTVLVLPDNTFDPEILTISVGDTVTWTNEGGLHNVNAPGFFRCANGCDGDGMGGSGAPATNDWSFTLTFDDPGTINYVCDVHVAVNMIGTVIVGEPADLTLAVGGSCPAPGQMDFLIQGATPNGEVFVASADSLGTSVIPAAGGACAGLPMDLDSPALARRLTADVVGRVAFPVELGLSLCNKFLQVVDAESCNVSNTDRAPAAEDSIIALEEIPLTGQIISPTDIRNAGDGSNWLFISERAGRIKIWDGTDLKQESFLDVTGRVETEDLNQGFLGIVFHPDYDTNGKFYAHYTDLDGNTVVSEFSVTENPEIADPNSERILLTQFQPHVFHQGGPINFGPDGYLYIALGDGGPIGDPDDRGQDLTSFLGKILRIDVDGGIPYAIPPTNPFVGVPDVREEIWAYGLRQPWRANFDSLTGDFYIGEVGNAMFEEINVQPASSPGGVNYGWSLMEGNECFDPPIDCNDGSLHLPDLTYAHLDENGFNGCAVIGGLVYRGNQFPLIEGRYIYSDWCSGTMWVANNGPNGWTSEIALETGLKPTAFGEAEDGEIYVGEDRGFYRIVENPF